MWLEKYLSNYNRILIMVSHSQDFMNGVCTNIMHMQDRKLKSYTVSESNIMIILE